MEIQCGDEYDYVRYRTADKLGWRAMEVSRDGVLVGTPPGQQALRRVPPFSLDMNAAWEILRNLVATGAKVRMENPVPGTPYYAVEIQWSGGLAYRAAHPKAPLAICLAYLLTPPGTLIGTENKRKTVV